MWHRCICSSKWEVPSHSFLMTIQYILTRQTSFRLPIILRVKWRGFYYPKMNINGCLDREVGFTGEARDPHLLHNVQTRSDVHSASIPMGNGGKPAAWSWSLISTSCHVNTLSHTPTLSYVWMVRYLINEAQTFYRSPERLGSGLPWHRVKDPTLDGMRAVNDW
jgi:hypothetical protein